MSDRTRASAAATIRRAVWRASAALAVVGAVAAGSAAQGRSGQEGAAEIARLRIGLPVHGTGWLPIYLGAERTFREEGVAVEIVAFNGGPALGQALAAGSVDVAVHTLDGLLQMIAAGPAGTRPAARSATR